MEEKIELNIQPDAGILGVFSRLSYKPYYAIAEFVDNSTASFYEHIQSLKFYHFNKLTVYIDYDKDENTLTIKDDAYGMEISDFKRAITLDSPPENRDGRNEFGMGLKTAASWFGEYWSVESTQLGSTNRYFAEVDIDNLKENKINSIEIDITNANNLEHGTTITIKRITKKINAPKTMMKIREILESMYRRDISSANNRIDIFFNGDKLSYETPEPLKFRDKEWKKEVNFVTIYDGVEYPVSGFVGILKNGGYKKAGFALFRRDRVVVGGADNNYVPLEIYQQTQSTIAHKLYGELNLDSFPVNQAKDGFVWDGGLEEKFLKDLKLNIQEYIKVAKLTNKERMEEEEFSQEKSDSIHQNIQNKLNKFEQSDETNTESEEYSDAEKEYLNNLKEDKKEPQKLENLTREYTLPLKNNQNKNIKVIWAIADNGYWFDYDDINSIVTINMNFDFFKPYVKDEKFKEIIESFILAFIIAEDSARFSNVNGMVSANLFSHEMNKALVKFTKE